MDGRQQFEEKYPLPEGMYFDNQQNTYAGTKDFWLWCARWESWQASRSAIKLDMPRSFSEDRHFRDVYEVEDVLEVIHTAGIRTK